MKVIVFQGQSQYDVLRTYSSFYTQQFQQYGIEAITCDMNIIDSEMYLELVKNFKPDFTISLNPTCYFYENSIMHFNKTQTPHLVLLGDNPNYHLFNRALKNPEDNLVFSIITEKFFEYNFKQMNINRYYKKHIVPAKKEYEVPYTNKIYSTVFFGSYINPDKILHRLSNSTISKELQVVIHKFCNIVKEHVIYSKTILSEPLEVYFNNYLFREYKWDFEQINKVTKEIFYFIDHYYRNLIRQIVLTTFAVEKLEMLVFGGEDTASLLNKFENVKVMSPVNYIEYINILAHSKFAINITPMFTSFHERISTTLFNSTVLCSNFMEDLVSQHPELLESSIFFNLNNLKETVQFINEIDTNKDEYTLMIEKGLHLATKKFTFQKDIEEIIKVFNNNF